MIRADSRYVDGQLVVQQDHTVAVRRVFPEPSQQVVLYTWLQSDRLDRIAAMFLGDPGKWWQIMDVNPTVQDPYDIRPGQQIRIPNSV